ncbi:PKD domain-containing protein, partial [Zoogloea sp.]|uniref:PKD domain-containing protein n=1 Tax=Zoogloea sp. TaxID=49181 RepID=UPI0035B16260
DSDVVLLDTLFAGGFSDVDGQSLAAIRILTLPASGSLTLNGLAVLPGQEIDVAELAAGRLIYRGSADFAGTDQFRWTGSDGNTFSSQSVFTNITLNNVNDGPRLEAGPTRSASEGYWFSQGLTLADPDVGNSYAVTVDWGYSVGGVPVVETFSTSSKAPVIAHVFPDNGSYTVTVTVNDQQGQPNSIESDSFTVLVDNIAPTLALAGDNTVEQGHVYTLTLGGVSDPGTDTVTQYIVDWGDGSPAQTVAAADLPASRQLTHTYGSAAAYTIRTQLVDEDGSFPGAGSKLVTVAPPAEVIEVNAGADTGIGEGVVFTRDIVFTDPADQDPAGRTATVNWGDGTPVQTIVLASGQYSFNIAHIFADDRATPFHVEVSVTDDGFQTDTDSFEVGVYNVAPVLPLSGTGSVNEGSSYVLNLGPVIDVAADTVTEYRIDWGDGSPLQILAPADIPASRLLAHVYADGNVGGSLRQVAVTLVDEDGVYVNAGLHSLVVANVPPSLVTAGAASVAEGSVYELTVGPRVDPGADTPTHYRIDWGDGTAQNLYTADEYATLLASGGKVTHVFADGASNPTINIHVLDEDGDHIAASRSVSVNDVAPAATLAAPATVAEGSSFMLQIGSIVDPGSDTVTQYRIHWGDEAAPGDVQLIGAAELAALGGKVAHTYADGARHYAIEVSVANEDGVFSLGTQPIDVLNVAPVAPVGGAALLDEGAVFTLSVGAIVDPGADTRSGYSIDWGDGNVSSFTPADWLAAAGSFTHVFADGAASPTVTVRATDEDGSFVLGTHTVTVNNVAPTAPVSGAASVAEGAVFALSVGAIVDPGTDTRSGYSIDWGDGNVSSFTPAEWLVAAGSFTHVFADGAASPTVTVRATDEDGSFVLGTHAVAVTNVAPTVVLGGATGSDEGASYSLSIAGSDPAGVADPLGYSIDWGDGSAVQSLSAAELAALGGTVSHVFADDADGPANATARTVTVTASDGDGGTGSATHTVTVNNVAPTAPVSGAASVAEGAVFALSVGAIVDPGTDTRSGYSIDWGDGNVSSFTPAEWLAAAGSFTHV